MSKPKNRVTFTRQRQAPPPEPDDGTNEIPRASKQEIRHLIENEGATSTTRIAEILNEGRFPPATAEKWTAALVDSALRRQDMEGLKDLMKENRGETEETDGPSLLAIKQAAYDGAKEALTGSAPEVKIPEIPPVQIDTFHVKAAVADAAGLVFKGFRKQIDEANEECASKVASRVRGALDAHTKGGDLASIRRVTDKTGENVGKVLSKVDETCSELHEAVVGTLQTHSKAVIDACELMALQVSEDMERRVNARFDALEDALVQKFTVGMDIDLDATLARVVDARLKAHMDEMANRLAVMVEKMRASLTGDKVRKVK